MYVVVPAPILSVLGLLIALLTAWPARHGAAQCGDNIVLNPGFEDVGPPCGPVPPNGLINGAFNQSCVDPWQAAWGTPSVCAFDVYAGAHVACFGSNNEGMFQEVVLEPDPCGPYTLTFWFRGISGLNGNLHVYLANGLVNVPTSNSGNPPLVIQPDWDLLAILPVTNNSWQQAVIHDVEATDPANTQLLFLDVPTGTLDVSIDDVFLGYLPPDPENIGFTIACIDQANATFTLDATVADPPPGFDPDAITWDLGDGNTASGGTVTHTYAADGVYTVCATFPDACGCLVETCTTITVDPCACACGTDDLPPAFASLPPLFVLVDCAAEIPEIPVLSAVDACDDLPVITYAETGSGPVCDRVITRLWTAADACGNTAIAAQVIEVRDTEAPEWVVEPADVTVGCDDVEQAFEAWAEDHAGATAVDNCGGVTLQTETLATPGPTCADGQIAVSATDQCGNTILRIATFHVENAPPEILSPATDLVSACGAPPPAVLDTWLAAQGGAVAAADCGAPAWANDFIALTGDSTPVTFTAENACGLTETTMAWIIAGDDPAPLYDTTFTCDPASAGTTETTVVVGECAVPLFLTAVYAPGDTVRVDSFICEGMPGQDTLHFINRFGCDSLVLQRIILVPDVVITLDITTCRPDTIGETTILIPGTPCDTILQINVTIPPPDETLVADTVCDPQQAGTDVVVLTGQDGCDSIVVFDHLYVPPPLVLLTIDSCGTGTDVIDTVRVPGIPCDSLIITLLTFHPPVLTELTARTCDPLLTEPDTLLLTTMAGCDSTVITNYIYRPADTTYIGLETCDPALVASDTLLLQDSGGCDSLIIRTTAYAGVDTIRVLAETCDPASAGTTITVRPGMPCDTVVKTTTLLVPTLTRRDTIEACGKGVPATDTLRFTSSFGCDSLVYRTTVFNPLEAVVDMTNESCAGDADGSIQVVSVAGGTAPYSASLNGGPFTEGQGGDLPHFDDLVPGQYTIIVRDDDDCRDTTDLMVQNGASLFLSAGAELSGEPGTTIQLSGASGDPAGAWQWTAMDPLSCDTCLSTLLGPLTSAQWAVLSGITPAGCTNVDSVFINLRADLDWSVPNIFSPNGDGLNDLFRPAVSDETAILMRFEIYDRWGGLLFAMPETQPASLFRGWDGTMNGQPASPGVYVYVMEFGVPGQDNIRLSGDVTLLR